MKSLTYKLVAVFLAMSVVPMVVGVYGAFELQSAGVALRSNDQSLQELRALLESASDSLRDSASIQESASIVTAQIANAQEETSATLKDMGDTILPKSVAIAQMRTAIAEASAAERALLLALSMRHLDTDELNRARQNQTRNITAAMDAIAAAAANYQRLIQGKEEKAAWDALDDALAAWRQNHKEFMAEIQNLEALVADLVRGGPIFASSSRRAYDTIFVSGRATREECEKRIEALNQAISRAAESDVRRAMTVQTRSNNLVRDLSRDAEAASGRAEELRAQVANAQRATADASAKSAEALAVTTRRFWYMVAFSAAALLVFLSMGFVIAWNISRPIREMARHMTLIAKGDLASDVPGKEQSRGDEIGQLARAMQEMIVSNRNEIAMANAMAEGDYTRPMPLRSEFDQLGRALGTMVHNSNNTLLGVSRAVERVGNGAAAVREASRSLSVGAQTSASALEEISQTVNHVDVQAKDNAAHAQQANQLATASRDAARRGYDAVTELVTAMDEIQQSGKKIASVAKLIDDIAFQTNLLALNAAVEAARAGRQGKGFSVVADEVRNLSGRSAKAARETSAMVAAMTQRMEAGEQLASRTDTEFREIVEATSQVAQLFQDITVASNAQSVAMAQISQGLGQIDSVIQENTANASRTAVSAQTLSRQADELREMVARFHLITDAMKTISPDSPPTVGNELPHRASDTRLLAAP